MSHNPYAPPEAHVADIPAGGRRFAPTPIFFPVSLTKLIVLSFCTLGIYDLCWFYKNWRLIYDREDQAISPFWRTFFAVIFCYSLFDHIRNYNDTLWTRRLPAGILAGVWILLEVLWRLPDPYWVVSFANVFVLVPVQIAANAINRVAVPEHDRNSRFTAINWIVVVVAVLFASLVLIGMTLPEE